MVLAAGADAPDQAEWIPSPPRCEPSAGVTGAAPYLEVQALAVHQPDMLPVVLRGIDPLREGNVSDIAKVLRDGALSDLASGNDHVLVGDTIARQLGHRTR